MAQRDEVREILVAHALIGEVMHLEGARDATRGAPMTIAREHKGTPRAPLGRT